jgi:hypothetical protein
LINTIRLVTKLEALSCQCAFGISTFSIFLYSQLFSSCIQKAFRFSLGDVGVFIIKTIAREIIGDVVEDIVNSTINEDED